MELYDIEKKVSWNGDEFIDEILVDFSNEGEEEELGLGCGGDDVEDGNISADTSTVSTAVDSCNSSFSGEEAVRGFAGAGLSGDLCEPQLDELAELEWLSNFGEESFSSEDLQKLQIISPSGLKSNTLSTNPVIIKTETISTSIKTEPTFTTTTIPSPSSSFTNRHSAAATSHPGLLIHLPCKARSKRSRSSGPSSWSSAHILGLGPAPAEPSDSNSTDPILVKKLVNKQPKKREMPMFALAPLSAGRRCLHCETDKTPQWRTGPMGPKTLCNACGVRYKSGRLVPEYRPAASPTFVVSRHSNSHRKVVELRRQKEMHLQHLQQHQLLLHHGASPAHERNGDDFLIHHQIGPNFQQLI